MRKLLLALPLFVAFNIQGQEISERNDRRIIPDKSVTRTSGIEGKKVALGKFNYIEIGGYSTASVSRHIDVYLEEKNFSETNLKILFGYISKENPDPNHLTVSVHTNRRQFDPCCDQPESRACTVRGISEQPARPDEYDYYQATYWRRKNREYFKYSQKLKIDASEFKTVIIKNN